MNYAVRLSYGYDNQLENLATYLQGSGICSKFAIYEHPLDANVQRTHIHALIMGLNVSTDTVKNKIEECLGFRPSGNKEWSFKTSYKPYGGGLSKDVDDYFIIYMSKGKYDAKAYKGYTIEELDNYKKKYVPKTADAKIDIVDGHFVVDDTERKSLTRRQMLSLMIAKYDAIANERILCPDQLMRRTVRMIGSVLRAQGEPFGENKVMEFYDSVIMHCESTKWETAVCQRLRQRYR